MAFVDTTSERDGAEASASEGAEAADERHEDGRAVAPEAPADEDGEADEDDEDGGGTAIHAPPAEARSVRDWLHGARLPARWHLGLGLVVPMVLLIANMVRVRSFTIDDSYISYRYARNFARGLGLVYNPGEQIEGYTNFLWTVLLGLGIRLGIDPDVLAKVLGGLAACGSLGAIYLLSKRLRPHGSIPCIATWLFASSIVQTGYAVFGLETSFFVFLILAGTEMMFRERDRGAGSPFWSLPGFPASALLFGLAGLTRPEAPLFLGVPMLFLGLRCFAPQNLLRGVVFLAPIAAHMVWRHSYYGTWITNTATAKTGDLSQQLAGGQRYLTEYAQHTSPVLVMALFGICLAVVAKHRDAICFAVLSILVLAYILVVGGDWMPCYRFLGTYEPYGFLLAGFAARSLLEALMGSVLAGALVRGERRGIAFAGALGVLAVAGLIALGAFRTQKLKSAQRRILDDEKVFWDSAAGGAAEWLKEHGKPGEIAVGDIGYIGYVTDYPVLDLLGLVDPVISKLPGGYTRKTGPGYVEHVFEKAPRYFVFVGGKDTCNKLPFPAQERLRRDRRFQGVYDVGGMIRHSKGGYWCVFERREGAVAPAPKAEPPRKLDFRPNNTAP